jgi:flagellar protein FlaF
MLNSAQQAYDTGTKATTSTREIEASALFKAARTLEICQQKWESPDSPVRFKDALRRNLCLWSLFQAELARPDHGLPKDLRVDLLRLSAFIDRRTFELLAKPERKGLQILIEINRQVALGLAATPTEKAIIESDTQ